MTQATLSFHMTATEISIAHNNRTINVSHSDKARQKDNYYWPGNKSLQQAYEDLFSADVEEYNSRQKRKDRKINNYLSKITEAFEKEKGKLRKLRNQGATTKTLRQNKKVAKPCYEFIITIGNLHDNPEFNAKDGERKYEAKHILQQYVEDFVRRYNNKENGVELFNASIHMCENGQVHLHCDVIFHSSDNKRGLQHQVSMNKALEQMGFIGDEHSLPITKWEEYEKGILRGLCAEHDIEIIAGKGSKEHQHKQEYILEQEKQRNKERELALDEQEAMFSEFLENSETGNAFLLLKENEFLRQELSELQQQEEQELDYIAEIWNTYKKENSEYWSNYKTTKEQLKYEIHLASQQKSHDQEKLRRLFSSIFNGNEFIIIRLFKLLSALALKIRIDREEQKLEELKAINKKLKSQATVICNASKETAEALHSKDYDRIYSTFGNWEQTLKSIHNDLETVFESPNPQKESKNTYEEI